MYHRRKEKTKRNDKKRKESGIRNPCNTSCSCLYLFSQFFLDVTLLHMHRDVQYRMLGLVQTRQREVEVGVEGFQFFDLFREAVVVRVGGAAAHVEDDAGAGDAMHRMLRATGRVDWQ